MHGGRITSGLTGRRRRTNSNGSNKSSANGSNDEYEDDSTTVDSEQGNVLMHIISQLRPGADLSRVVLPTFILEPRSMLERITNFMCHPEMLLDIPQSPDPVDRFVSVVKFYLSGWHIRPPGVKKPLNPILGEVFSCYWDLPDDTRAYYVSEQTSHHPPKSSYFYAAPHHHIRIDGTLKPKSKFLGNSAASLMEGIAVLTLTNRGKDPKKGERYWLTQPNMYARGILFGNMKYELGDQSVVRCPELGLTADIEFKTKGWVGGTYNAIGGVIRNDKTGEQLFELSGLWSEEMFIKDLRTGQKEMFFNAQRQRASKPRTRPIEEQDDRESIRIWRKTAQAVKDRNHELATDEKTKIEDMQREEAARRTSEGVTWHPRLFKEIDASPGSPEEGLEELEWIINKKIEGATPEEQEQEILSIYPIIKGQKVTDAPFVSPQESAGHPPTAGKPAAEDNENDVAHAEQVRRASAAQQQAEGESKATTPTQPTNTSSAGDDIASMLKSTGKDAGEGPLIDFSKDMKKDLPAMASDAKSTKTAASSTENFFDAES